MIADPIKEVEDILSDDSPLEFDEIMEVSDSPLNQKVKEKEIIGAFTPPVDDTPEQFEEPHDLAKDQEGVDPIEAFDFESGNEQDVDNVPEQEFNVDPEMADSDTEEPEVGIPDAAAKQMADTIIGAADNLLALTGHFVKIEKEQEFFEFEDVIKSIDDINEKNVARMRLDKEEKRMLKPLIVQITKKKAKVLSPEQQMLIALGTIGARRVQATMEMRAEIKNIVPTIKEMINNAKAERETTESHTTASTNTEQEERGANA